MDGHGQVLIQERALGQALRGVGGEVPLLPQRMPPLVVELGRARPWLPRHGLLAAWRVGARPPDDERQPARGAADALARRRDVVDRLLAHRHHLRSCGGRK